MMENDDVQELSDDHGARHEGPRDHDAADHGDRGLRMKAPDHDQSQGNKHSYFLRAKAPRFLGLQVGDEVGEFKKPSSVGRERAPSFRSKADHHFGEYTSLSEEEDLANCLVMLSNKSRPMCSDEEENKAKEVVEKGMFQCKACKKVFSSHQALGGHRASHKKVKGCFASKIEDEKENMEIEEAIDGDQDSTQLPPTELDSGRPTRKRGKMHECSVCLRVFSSGQALGGHKRCHWLTTSTDNAFIPNFHDFQYDQRTQQLCKKTLFTKPHEQNHDHDLDLNLNLPPTPHTDRKLDSNNDDLEEDKTSTGLCLQQWSDQNKPKMGNKMERNDDEGCVMKLRKLSDLRDKNLDGGWLQMGIPSTSEMR